MPISLIALMELDRKWFKSCCGLDIHEVPRVESFFGHAILGRRALIVSHARVDKRLAANPRIIWSSTRRFHAGQRLMLNDDSCVGTLRNLGSGGMASALEA